MRGSQLHTRIRPQTATSYSEWLLVFGNDSRRIREARIQLLLPPGGVVSRLTLNIEGQEQEAAFAQRKKVVQAYQAVVAKRRDPVLVTTSGPDRVFVQAFPVLPGGGSMQVRIGITAPLIATGTATGTATGPNKGAERLVLRLPRFQQRNFDVPTEVQHQLRIDAPEVITPARSTTSVTSRKIGSGGYRLRGQLSNAQLDQGWMVELPRDPAQATVWTHDLGPSTETLIEQRLLTSPVSTPAHIVLVIDSSQSMIGQNRLTGTLINGLRGLPRETLLTLLIAGDRVTIPLLEHPLDQQTLIDLGDIINGIRFVGGSDNRPALIQALAIAKRDADANSNANANNVVLWLHGQQPVTLGAERQNLPGLGVAGSGSARLFSLALTPGLNRLADALADRPGVTRLLPLASPLDELGAQLARWRGELPLFRYHRQKLPAAAADSERVIQRDDDVARLWALERVDQLSASDQAEDRQRAIALASHYQIVTSVSGAVVLENAAQYQQAGLKQVDPRAPALSIPLPTPWSLFLLAGMLLAGVRRIHTASQT